MGSRRPTLSLSLMKRKIKNLIFNKRIYPVNDSKKNHSQDGKSGVNSKSLISNDNTSERTSIDKLDPVSNK